MEGIRDLREEKRQSRLVAYGRMVMFSHTVFSLPFALAGALTTPKGFPGWNTLLWVVVAFLGGRNSANAVNRIVDRKIDAENPRTAGRHLPSGRVSLAEATLLALFFFGLLVFAAFRLNRTCVYLLPLAGALFLLYSFTKRFTWLCHLFLGATCAAASVGGWVAVTGTVSWQVLLLGAANALWVMGFDIIYATSDAEHDRIVGLYSIPSVFGVTLALVFAAVAHFLTLLLLIGFGIVVGLGLFYYLGVGVIGVLFLYQHRLVRPGWLEKVFFASYTVNQIVGLVFFIAVVGDFLVRGGLF
ncbi:4-hydroxybenzoate polyprenyltransferase [Sediminispirochaeta smaragdinae DSM 11293]|jgi:4-hydroxybenzoate polyprenyltransferase|uniref:4-hydroxybenzoate polyprenyltransferase n=1 Tax=Sediminispirochaeta smaragdinae (strain DSM 11293 / JCM 15392 / SEBR 4228) TaxID=573413 RepID=E1R9H2_SEDSS|nr:4-hydroxybenzoate polyprenyltransferase [Sediminispirochaeta smaragdinae DSM 11293]